MKTIDDFHTAQSMADRRICDRLKEIIERSLPDADSRIWHGHPVWFLDDNPIVGYSKLKTCVRLMFWSGADFDEPDLMPGTGKFRDASARFTSTEQINTDDLSRWLEKSRRIRWDYKGIYKRKGTLVRLETS